MNASQFRPGARVALIADIAPYPLGAFPAGARGKVVHVEKMATPGCPIANVRMDDHFADLDDWDNELQVFRPDDGEITPAAFRLVE